MSSPSEIVEFLKARLDEDEERLDAIDHIQAPAGHMARERREVEVKRRIVDDHEPVILRGGSGARYYETTRVCRSCEPPRQFPESAVPCQTLKLLASVYADHPDYRGEWRPD